MKYKYLFLKIYKALPDNYSHAHRFKPFIFLLLAAAFLTCSKSREKPENADAFFRSITKTYTLNEDGSMDYSYAHELDLYSYMAFNRQYGETFIVYNPRQQDLNVTRSTTIMEDGTEVPSPDNAYNEVLPRFAEGAPAFNHLREMVVTHTGLERNSTVLLNYTIHTRAGYFPFFSGMETFARSSPVGEYKLTIRVPEKQELAYHMVGSKQEPKISEKKGFTVYTWNVKDIAPQEQAGHQPKDNLPGVVFSTADMSESILYLRDILNTGLPENVKKKSLEMKDMSSMEAVKKVRKIVTRQMNNYPVPFEHAGFEPRSSNEVWNANGGTPMEKAGLISAFLNEAGVRANPVVAVPDAFYDKKVGALQAIDDVLVELHLQEKNPVLISPTAMNNHNLWEEYQDMYLMPVATGIRELLVLDKPQNSSELRLQVQGRLSDDLRFRGDAGLYMEGAPFPFLEFNKKDNYLKSLFPIPADNLRTPEVLTCNQQGCRVTVAVYGHLPARKQKNYRFVQLPESSRGLKAWDIGPLAESRRSALEIPYPLKEIYQMKWQLPAGMQLVNASEKVVENEAGKVEIRFQQQKDTLSIIRKIHIPQKIYPDAMLKAVTDLLDIWQQPAYKQVVLKAEEQSL